MLYIPEKVADALETELRPRQRLPLPQLRRRFIIDVKELFLHFIRIFGDKLFPRFASLFYLGT